eukprot:CAMPEP_0175903512 /NCGR_PEP_ID=MMETSP0108-20121206/3977_1 /TAXON_ID=195067 ORGANISM="Goniomonas pacifica, Strain CCMP1869" /NCGR_SAMPLE_ID=MMETSP0108 /ASSEMBLY_ACC=CAM_ASM_000204 /LENGTH=200 /DNA_ID=CAMNT_0017225251 /DNA_START=14 /DNA_END=616 /DNA_ORIENTATION=+
MITDDLVVQFKPEHWVTLHVKLVTWDYLNFTVTVPTSVRVFAIQEKIKEQHDGSINDVVLYREKMLPKNRITESEKTLEEVGIEGGLQGAGAQCVLWYDFTPHQSQCPLLLSSPRDGKPKRATAAFPEPIPSQRRQTQVTRERSESQPPAEGPSSISGRVSPPSAINVASSSDSPKNPSTPNDRAVTPKEVSATPREDTA